MKPVRVGFVGLGGICRRRHVPGLQRIDGVDIRAVANRSRESSERAAQEFDIPEVCDGWMDLVARDSIDAVFIGTWPYMHCPVAVAALNAGKHVFCQARMAMNEAEAVAMCRKAAETHLVAMVCPVPIGLRIDATIARLIRSGDLGILRLVRVQSFSDACADPGAPMTWRKDHRLSGLNMHTLGMYVEVIHRWFGRTNSVSAMTQTFIKERHDAKGMPVRVEIPDQVLVNTTLEAGFPVQYVFSTVVHQGRDVIEMYGSEATLRYDVAKDRLYMGRAAAKALEPAVIPPEEVYDVENWRVERDFIEAIRHGTEYHPDFRDGLRYMQVVQAIYDSAAEQRTVRLAEALPC